MICVVLKLCVTKDSLCKDYFLKTVQKETVLIKYCIISFYYCGVVL